MERNIYKVTLTHYSGWKSDFFYKSADAAKKRFDEYKAQAVETAKKASGKVEELNHPSGQPYRLFTARCEIAGIGHFSWSVALEVIATDD